MFNVYSKPDRIPINLAVSVLSAQQPRACVVAQQEKSNLWMCGEVK